MARSIRPKTLKTCDCCDFCRYYEKKNERCRRYPPVVVPARDGVSYVMPRVKPTQYCGEFVRSEMETKG